MRHLAAQPSDGWIKDWLSAGKFATYLTVSGGSRERALDLYEWNARLSAAFLHDLSHLEVGLRNACDRELTAAAIAADTRSTDPATLLMLFPVASRRNRASGRQYDANAIPRSNVERARKSATTARRTPPVSGKTVAEIMFGFWTYLFSDLHEKTIWVPYLHKAFPPGTDRNQLSATLASLRDFRNRVAHHEHILTGSEAERRRIVSIVRLLSPDAVSHLVSNSEVSTILAERP